MTAISHNSEPITNGAALRAPQWIVSEDGTERPLYLTEAQAHALWLIGQEMMAQDRKWGPQTHSNLEWNAIAGEEAGEAATEVNRNHFGGVENREALVLEVTQTAAVYAQWLRELTEGTR